MSREQECLRSLQWERVPSVDKGLAMWLHFLSSSDSRGILHIWTETDWRGTAPLWPPPVTATVFRQRFSPL